LSFRVAAHLLFVQSFAVQEPAMARTVKKPITACFVAAVLLAGVGGCAATQEPPQARSDEEIIRALDDEERLAVLNRDIPALERLWSESFTVNTPANRVNAGRQAVIDGGIHSGVIDYSSFERTIEHLRIDGDIAVVMGAETIIPADGSPAAGRTVHRRYTHVWRREGETWRLLARHANITPGR
jgi:ketosteroid isomerase-like protein